MATKDISDIQVLNAYVEMKRQIDLNNGKFEYADDILHKETGQPIKVCFRAMERAERNGLLEYGMWLRGGWITEKGIAFLNADKA